MTEPQPKITAPTAAPAEASSTVAHVDAGDTSSVSGVETRRLGATAVVNCEIWSSDFRERLAEDNPLRRGMDEVPAGGSKKSVDGLRDLHQAALVATKIVR